MAQCDRCRVTASPNETLVRVGDDSQICEACVERAADRARQGISHDPQGWRTEGLKPLSPERMRPWYDALRYFWECDQAAILQTGDAINPNVFDLADLRDVLMHLEWTRTDLSVARNIEMPRLMDELQEWKARALKLEVLLQEAQAHVRGNAG